MATRRDFIIQTAALAVTPDAGAGATSRVKVPVRLAVYGLAHDHVRGALPRIHASPEVVLVGVMESDRTLVNAYAEQYGLSRTLFVPTLDALCERTRIDAVAAFTSTFDHGDVVAQCARRRLHVMMEKPLAVSLVEAQGIASIAQRAGIHVLVNYDTTWYPSTAATLSAVRDERRVGVVRKAILRAGHSGPGPVTSPQFLRWLTDPKLNGGGVVSDFGCYGTTLLVCLMTPQRPTSVTAVLQTFHPERYSRIDDEATLLITYPGAVGIAQASYNWPHNRKDMAIYGEDGELHQRDAVSLGFRVSDRWIEAHEVSSEATTSGEVALRVTRPSGAFADEFAYLAAVVRGELAPSGPSSLAANLESMAILDAARASAASGQRVSLADSSRSHSAD